MPDTKISQLDSTTSVNTGAMFPLSQTESGNLKTVKGTVDQIGDYVATVQDHSTLTTTSKKLVGAIEEKMDKANPTGTGALSIGRKSGTTTGSQSVAVGYNAEASGARAVALGHAVTASGANGSFAEGYGTTASGEYGSHAEGRATTASGNNGSHAEGYETQTTSDSTSSHAEGYQTTSGGLASHSEGIGTIAQRRSQHVFGDYNIADTQGANANAKGAYIEIVGKGSSDANRSNARTLDWSGNETLAGGLKLHENQDAATLSLVGPIATGGGTLDCSSYSDGAIIYLYRPTANKVGIYAKADTWTRVIPIVSISTVSVSGYVITNNDANEILRGTVIST